MEHPLRNEMSTCLGYIVTDDRHECNIKLHGTLVIREEGLAINGTWSTDSKTDGLSFELKYESTAAVDVKLPGEFSFNGSFDFAGKRIPEKCVNILVSRLDTRVLSIDGWGMNKLGVFKVYGEGECSNADGTEYKVSLQKTYILEDCSRTILWKMHSVDSGPSVLCVGEVTSFDMKQSRVRVLFYKDGKFEWLSLENSINIATTPVPRTNANLNLINIGARISKHFLLQNGRSRKFLGRVISSHSGERYTIEFDDDGSEEEMEGDLVRHLLDCTERRQLELVSKMNARKIATASEVIELLDDDDDDNDDDDDDDGDCIDDIMNRKSCEADWIEIEDRLKLAKCRLEVKTSTLEVAKLELELKRATQHKGSYEAAERIKASKVKLEDTVDLQASPSNQKRARVSL